MKLELKRLEEVEEILNIQNEDLKYFQLEISETQGFIDDFQKKVEIIQNDSTKTMSESDKESIK